MDAPGNMAGVEMKLPSPDFQIMQEFDGELSRYERIIGMTTTLLGPILESVGPESAARPEEAPTHDLHNLILRLRRLNNQAEDLRSRIRL